LLALNLADDALQGYSNSQRNPDAIHHSMRSNLRPRSEHSRLRRELDAVLAAIRELDAGGFKRPLYRNNLVVSWPMAVFEALHCPVADPRPSGDHPSNLRAAGWRDRHCGPASA
jgi:hypothetical protein